MSVVINCRFCDLPIERSRVTPHYRRMHKATDLALARRLTAENRITRLVREELDLLIDIIDSESFSDEIEHVECIMCLENHSTRLLPCNHDNSCHDCLMTWWKQSFHAPRCPICRTDVKNIYRDGEEDTIILSSWYTWRRRRLNQGRERRHVRRPTLISWR